MLITAHAMVPLALGALILAGAPNTEPQGVLQGVWSPGGMNSDPARGFEENRGQLRGPARFVARGRGFLLSLEPAGAVMELDRQEIGGGSAAVRMALAGARAEAHPRGREELPGKTHYLHGSDPEGWVRDVPSYAAVVYRDAYPGIDLVYRSARERIEYDFLVAPGADPGRIRIVFEGIERARVGADGDLVLETPAGEVRQHRPRIYQEAGGERREIAGGFDLRGPRQVGFQVGEYDSRMTLVIDPEISYSTYHGGSRGYQGIQDVALDAAGNAYVAGYFPWDHDRGPSDVFVSKLSPTGELLFRTNVGGYFADEAKAVAVDADGNIYLTGSTAFHCCYRFPTVNAFQPTHAGGLDAFVMKLDPEGRTILYSTFLGGAGDDRGADIEVDGSGRVHVAGKTGSPGFPTARPWQPSLAGGTDAFLAVFEPGGSALVFSTFLGGSGDESVARLALSGRGPVIAGTTSSADFPTRSSHSAGPVQRAFGGGSDAFLAALSATGSLEEATYLGGSGKDEAYGIALGGGFAYLTGGTDSPDFPTANPLQPTLSFPPEADAFLAKISLGVPGLAYSTYLEAGGAATCPFPSPVSDAPCGGVAVDVDGNAYVTARGVFVVRVDPAGARRLYTCNGFGGHAIAVSTPPALVEALASPRIFVAGRTGSPSFPTLNAFDSTHRWYETEEGWLTKLADGPNPGATFQERDPRISYSGTWDIDASPEHSGAAALRSMEGGARATITFTGTGLQVIGRRDPAAGVVKVLPSWETYFSIQTLDTYASPAEPRSVLVSYSGLSEGTYTVTLEVAGTQGGRSKGSWIWIDGINVLGAVPAAPAPLSTGWPASFSTAGGSAPSSRSPVPHERCLL